MARSIQDLLGSLAPKSKSNPLFLRDPPKRVIVPQPVIGNKFFCPTEKGTWVLEESPGMFVGWLCTAAGSGGVFVYDGIPDKNGVFEAIGDTPGQEEGYRRAKMTGNYDFNGRIIYSAVPPIMQPWQMNAGFKYGLTLQLTGNYPSIFSMGAITIGSCTWQKHGGRAEKKRP